MGAPPLSSRISRKSLSFRQLPLKKTSSYRELCPGPEMRVHLVSSYRKRNFHKWQSVLVHPGASETLSIIREGSEQVIRSLDKEWQISSKPMFAPLPPSFPPAHAPLPLCALAVMWFRRKKHICPIIDPIKNNKTGLNVAQWIIQSWVDIAGWCVSYALQCVF